MACTFLLNCFCEFVSTLILCEGGKKQTTTTKKCFFFLLFVFLKKYAIPLKMIQWFTKTKCSFDSFHEDEAKDFARVVLSLYPNFIMNKGTPIVNSSNAFSTIENQSSYDPPCHPYCLPFHLVHQKKVDSEGKGILAHGHQCSQGQQRRRFW